MADVFRLDKMLAFNTCAAAASAIFWFSYCRSNSQFCSDIAVGIPKKMKRRLETIPPINKFEQPSGFREGAVLFRDFLRETPKGRTSSSVCFAFFANKK